VKRGEIRWYTFALPDKRRPALILTRDEVIEHLNEIIVVPVTNHSWIADRSDSNVGRRNACGIRTQF